jgi:hypothetical protein
MNAANDRTALARSGMRRLILPWAWGHLRAVAAVRMAAGIFLTGLGVLIFAHGDHGLAALPLAGAAVNFVWGAWQLTIARTVSART